MKRFFLWFGIIAITLFVFIIVAYIFISALFDTEPYVPDESYLAITISGYLSEYQPPDVIQEQFGGVSLDMRRLRQTLQMAAVDDRIEGVVLKIGFVQCGFAKLQEIHQLINEYKKSNKKILAMLDVGLIRDYYIASACDSIYLQPEGNLLLTGLAAEVTFYKDLFLKLGIEADFEHIGKYKSYPDAYTRRDMSVTQEEVINNILDTRYEELISTIAAMRGLEKSEFEKLINTVSGFIPDEALSYNLIDGLKFSDEIPNCLADSGESLSKVSALAYSRISPSTLDVESGPRLAVIYCSGSIMGGEDSSDPFFGTTMGANRVIRNIRQAARNRSIKAIILRIDSPGGSGIASEKIWNAIIEAKKEKPVIASISDLGASGGYYMAIAADTIIAQKASLVGSIGVFIGKFSLEGLYKKIGLNTVSLQRGQNARMFSLNSKFSDSERRVIRKMIKDYYKNFVNKVAEARGKTFEEINEVAQGRTWNGEDAFRFGLIDTLGGVNESIAIAKKMAGILPGSKIRLVYYPKSRSFLNNIVRKLSVLENPVRETKHYLKQLQNRPVYFMPFKLEYN